MAAGRSAAHGGELVSRDVSLPDLTSSRPSFGRPSFGRLGFGRLGAL